MSNRKCAVCGESMDYASVSRWRNEVLGGVSVHVHMTAAVNDDQRLCAKCIRAAIQQAAAALPEVLA